MASTSADDGFVEGSIAAVRVRRFRIEAGTCRRCGRVWPAYLSACKECAAVIGEPRQIVCARVVPPASSSLGTPAFGVAMALELSRRRPPADGRWATELWGKLAPQLRGAIRVRPGPAGSIGAVWSFERPRALAGIAELALGLREDLSREIRETFELRGGLALGVIDPSPGSDAVERCAERLALAASPGQWLVSDEVARRLQERFQLGPVGIVPRWPMPFVGTHCALIAPLAPPTLPSAVSGPVPEIVVGRNAERCRLTAEIGSAAAGRRRVVLVSAPAGGGKSYLLRRVLADAEMRLAAGVSFPPLGGHPMDPLRALLAGLDETKAGTADERLAAALGEAAVLQARIEPSAIVVDDVHWAHHEAIATLHGAISATAPDAPVAWILSARTAALARIGTLVELTDARVELAPLEPLDRTVLLERRLGDVPEAVRAHVAQHAARGNPLYLEHLANAIKDGSAELALPDTLHEAILARLDGLVARARGLGRWSYRRTDDRTEVPVLERRLGDWLDRLETSDVADLATVGRYLARLRAADFELMIARSLLGMPVSANRRLAWALERLAAASTDALLDYLGALANEGQAVKAAYEARAAAERAEHAVRLDDAERLLAFAIRHAASPEAAVKRGDLAIARGRPDDALAAYCAAASRADRDADLARRVARTEALIGQVRAATGRLEKLVSRSGLEPSSAWAARLDLARLTALPPPSADGALSVPLRRRMARTMAWVYASQPEPAREAARSLVLAGEPAACAAELIETATLCRLAGVRVRGLDAAATEATNRLNNPRAWLLLSTEDVALARRTFLHWDA